VVENLISKYLYINKKQKTMSKDMREIIDKVKNFKQFVNENVNTPTEFIFSLGEKSNSQNNVLNYRKISELLMKQTPISMKYVDGDSSMSKPICMANISPSGSSKDTVEYECIPQIKTNSTFNTIRNTDTINGAIQTIQRYAESIYNDKVD
jgi:hypothetical protein